jgi:thiamine kinase-like enzyme
MSICVPTMSLCVPAMSLAPQHPPQVLSLLPAHEKGEEEAKDISEDMKDTESNFHWPSSAAPSATNLAIASRMCQKDLKLTGSIPTITPFKTGWSAHDCMKVSFPSHDRCYIVKIPRHHDPTSVVACKNEALRASWASKHGCGPAVLAIDDTSGAFIMEFINGQTLATDMNHVPSTIALIRRIHTSPRQDWMSVYHAPMVVKDMLHTARKMNTLKCGDEQFLCDLISWVSMRVGDRPQDHLIVPCHNDFHSLNIMLDLQGALWAIDFEDCNLGDPMWDLGYLTANLMLEPLALAEIYSCDPKEKERLEAYYYLALGHFAVWSATHRPLWVQHFQNCMTTLRQAWTYSSSNSEQI